MSYAIGSYRFDVERFFPDSLFRAITNVRVKHPEVILEEAVARRRRSRLVGDNGRLMILAADHPARRLTASAGDPLIMGDRRSYLGRLLRVLLNPACDGVLGSPDILDELLIVDHLIRQVGGASLLDGRLLVGSMNRGGLAGSAFEMDDTFTAHTVESMVRYRMDGAKLLLRIDTADPACVRTLTASGQAVTACHRAGLPMFLEPLPVQRTPEGYRVQKDATELIKIVGVASALGESSSGTWIKIPYCDGYEAVARSTTCPVLMLGGESHGDPSPVIREFAQGMRAGGSIRGALVGRNVHHPGADDPLAVSMAVTGVVHEGLDAEQAVERLMGGRGQEMDAIAQYFE
ncbi:MAG: hypothetical protein EXS64_14305 [Candidatus Latescibacteria bacterium]|nr:hypothetical protein [Candidatus Latescibacterota bacterium]